MRTNTVALVVSLETGSPQLVDMICDDSEIQFIEAALTEGGVHPLKLLYQQREELEKQENDFGDYVEELLSQPFLNREVQEHGVQWFKSRIKIQRYQTTERDAAKVIADYAYKIFEKDRTKTDFFLASSASQVRIRVFTLPKGVEDEIKAA